MRKIILNLAVTLDGYIEGPNGEIDWCQIEDSGSEDFFDEFLAGIDSIFYGRISYDLWGQYQPSADAADKKIWDNVHSKAKYVFSRQSRNDDNAIFISGDLVTEVEKLKRAPGKDIWLYGGASLITSFINAGLVDGFLLAVFPVVLGSGKPLFSDIKERIGLSLTSVKTSKAGIVLLDYSVKR